MNIAGKLKPKTLNEPQLDAFLFVLEVLNVWLLEEFGEGHKLKIESFTVPTRWVEDERVIVSGRIRVYRYRDSPSSQGYWSEVPEFVSFKFATLLKSLDLKDWERSEEDETYFNLTHKGTGATGSFFRYCAQDTNIGLQHDAMHLSEMVKQHLGANKRRSSAP